MSAGNGNGEDGYITIQELLERIDAACDGVSKTRGRVARMTMCSEFCAGWKRFWLTFTYPLCFVIGFGVAAAVSDFAFQIVKGIALEIWHRV